MPQVSEVPKLPQARRCSTGIVASGVIVGAFGGAAVVQELGRSAT